MGSAFADDAERLAREARKQNVMVWNTRRIDLCDVAMRLFAEVSLVTDCGQFISF